MSDKWEIVGKPAKGGKGEPGKKNGVKADKKNGVKKAAAMPKLEDVLPAASLQAMYVDRDQHNEEVVEKVPSKPKSPKADGTSKKTAKKEPAPLKPKVPSNLAEAVKMNLRVDDIRQLIEACQTKFPDSPLLWLRDLAAYLNLKLVNTDDSEAGIFEGVPLSALTANMKKAIVGMLNPLSESTKELLIETCISNTAHDLAKSLDTDGWRALTQVLADMNPALVTANLPRLIELRNSYQNRPAVGNAILWSVGQAGKKDLACGLRVWLEVMLPLLSMKHYSRFVVDYLAALLAHHSVTADTVLGKPVMDLNNFLTVQDTVFVVASGLKGDYGKQLRDLYPQLAAAALGGCRNHEIFPVLMDKLKHVTVPEQADDCLEILSKCLLATPAALVHWQKMYISQLTQSSQLLGHLDENWHRFKGVATPAFMDTIQAFQDYNESATHKEEAGVCRDICASLLSKFKRSGNAWFPWKTMSFLLLICTAAIINLDVEKNGSFKKSHLGLFLTDAGQYERVVNVYDASRNACLAGHAWSEQNLPVYYAKTREVVGPALDTSIDYAKMAGGFVAVKGGEVAALLREKGGDTFLVLQRKGGEAYLHLQDGLEAIRAQYPGLRDRAVILASTVREGSLRAADQVTILYQDLLAGKVDWAGLKDSALQTVQVSQTAALNAVHWAKAQLDQLIK